jgi:hypothetical protein
VPHHGHNGLPAGRHDGRIDTDRCRSVPQQSPTGRRGRPRTAGRAGAGRLRRRDQGQQPQDPQACGAGIANRAIGEAQNAADQAARAAGQNSQGNPSGDRPPQDLITNSACVIFNGAPTLIPPGGLTRTASPFDSPMEGKPCWYAFGVTPTH